MIVYKERLKDLLRKKNIKPWNLCYVYGFGKSQTSRILKGENISFETIQLLCEILGCQPYDFLSYETDPDTVALLESNMQKAAERASKKRAKAYAEKLKRKNPSKDSNEA